ncbi:MAG: sulfatase [Candidatus Brocadiae bacterium]|nr:sulfatase [Candidatus Brocadiia bacterium]
MLLICVDDLRPELGCYGHPQVLSPHIDKLAARGLLFERAYVQQAVCAPSRAVLLTGTRPDTTRIYGLSTPVRKAMPKVLTLPQHFKDHGYTTVSLGKIYHHRSDDNALGWSVPEWHPEGPWVGRGYRSDAAIAAVKKNDATTRGRKGIGPATDDADVPDDGYRDGVIADKAIAELRRLKGKPFFMALGFMKPHLPFNSPKRYWDLYQRDAIALPSFRQPPKDAPALALTNWGEMRQYTDIPQSGKLTDAKTRQLIHGYRACVSYMDAQVGRVLGELERLGLADDTIVLLWGDHGWKLGEYGSWCKHTNMELDTRSPIICHVPGQKNAGAKSTALVETVDIYPSLCEAAGLPLPKHLEGTSFVPLLDAPDRPWKRAAFSQYPRGKIMGYTLRSGRWRYTEWIDRKTKKVTARELYDHGASPVARANLAAAPEHKATVAALSQMLADGWQKARPTK